VKNTVTKKGSIMK